MNTTSYCDVPASDGNYAAFRADCTAKFLGDECDIPDDMSQYCEVPCEGRTTGRVGRRVECSHLESHALQVGVSEPIVEMNLLKSARPRRRPPL